MTRVVAILWLGLVSATASPQTWQGPLRPASRVTGAFPFGNRGGSWCVGPNCETVPVPTLDCLGSDYTGGATFTCSVSGGVTWTKTGTVTAAQATPFYPNRFSGANATGMLFDGSTGYFSGGDVLDQTGDFTICSAFWTTNQAADQTILSKDATGQRAFALRVVSSAVQLFTYKADGTQSSILLGTPTSNAWHVVCASYDFVADGTSVMRGNLDGVDATPNTTAGGPVTDVTAQLRLGNLQIASSLWSGVISRVTVWSGIAFSQAQLKQAVLSYWGLVGSSGQQVSVTRATTETCQINGANGTIYTMPNGVACVNEKGLQVFAASTNLVIRGDELDNADWVVASGTPTVTAGAGASLYDTDTAGNVADDVEDNDATVAECIKAAARCGTTTGTYSASAYVKSVTGQTAATLRIVTDGTGTVTCETTGLSTSAYRRIVCANKAITGVVTSNDLWICPGRFGTVADMAKIRVFGVQCEAIANVTPIIRAAGASATRNLPGVSWALPSGTLKDAGGQLAATVTTPSTWVAAGGNYILVGVGDAPMLAPRNAGAAAGIFDGTQWSQTTITSIAGRTARLHSWWSGTTACATELGVACTTGTYDGTIVPATLWFGSQGGTNNPINGSIADVRLCRAPGGCE